MSVPAPKNRTFPDEIVEQLRQRILRGELGPGDRLPPERELAVKLGTNRNTLREALRSLEAQGLVQARQGDGVRVLDFRASGEMSLLAHYFPHAEPRDQVGIMADLLRLRSTLAREVVARAGTHGTNEELLALRHTLQKLAVAYNDQNAAGMMRAELELHRRIVVASKSLTGLWLFNSLERVIVGFVSASPGLWITTNDYMEKWRAIVEHLMAREGAAASATLEALFNETDELIASMLRALEAT